MSWHSSMDLPPLTAEEKLPEPDPGSGAGSSAIFCERVSLVCVTVLFGAFPRKVMAGQQSVRVLKRWVSVG